MSTQIVITLPDEVYARAERLAHVINRDVADLLADTVELSLPPLGTPTETATSIAKLTDQEVLALTELQLESSRDQRLSVLLDKQQAGQLSEGERSELLALMQLYQEGILRKAQALHEAVRRGLREPLEP